MLSGSAIGLHGDGKLLRLINIHFAFEFDNFDFFHGTFRSFCLNYKPSERTAYREEYVFCKYSKPRCKEEQKK